METLMAEQSKVFLKQIEDSSGEIETIESIIGIMCRARNLTTEEKLENILSQSGETYAMCVVVSILAMAFSWNVTTFREASTLSNTGIKRLLRDLQPFWTPGIYDSTSVKLIRNIKWEEEMKTGHKLEKDEYWWCTCSEQVYVDWDTNKESRKHLEVSALLGTYNARPLDRWNNEDLLGAHYGGKTGRSETLEIAYNVWPYGPNISNDKAGEALVAWNIELNHAWRNFTWGVWLKIEMMEQFTDRNRFNWMKLCWELKQHIILTVKGTDGEFRTGEQNYVGTAIKCWQNWLENFEVKESELHRLQRISATGKRTGYNICVAWEQSHACINEAKCTCLHIGPTSPTNEKWRCG
jgi:hypothetical protein